MPGGWILCFCVFFSEDAQNGQDAHGVVEVLGSGVWLTLAQRRV